MYRYTLARACALAAALATVAACSDGGGGALPPTTAAGPVVPPAPSSSTTATSIPVRLIEVAYAGGQVAGGVQRTTVRVGETVRIRVTSDVADEVHVHTYDVKAEVAPGRPAELELVASIPGRHEVELEVRHRQLLVLEVR